MRTWRGDFPQGEKALNVFFGNLLTMKANSIKRTPIFQRQYSGRRLEIVLGLLRPVREDFSDLRRHVHREPCLRGRRASRRCSEHSGTVRIAGSSRRRCRRHKGSYPVRHAVPLTAGSDSRPHRRAQKIKIAAFVRSPSRPGSEKDDLLGRKFPREPLDHILRKLDNHATHSNDHTPISTASSTK